MPRQKEYESDAERQRAYRKRLIERNAAMQIPQIAFTNARGAALEALHQIEELQRAAGVPNHQIHTTANLATLVKNFKLEP